MTLAEFLSCGTAVVYITVNTAVMFYAFAAYRLRRELAFLLLTCSGALGVFLTASDYTLGRQSMGQAEYYWWWCARQAGGILDGLFWGAATLLLLRLAIPQARRPTLRNVIAQEANRKD